MGCAKLKSHFFMFWLCKPTLRTRYRKTPCQPNMSEVRYQWNVSSPYCRFCRFFVFNIGCIHFLFSFTSRFVLWKIQFRSVVATATEDQVVGNMELTVYCGYSDWMFLSFIGNTLQQKKIIHMLHADIRTCKGLITYICSSIVKI